MSGRARALVVASSRRHTRAAVRHVRDVGLLRDERTMLEGARRRGDAVNFDSVRCRSFRRARAGGERSSRADGGDPRVAVGGDGDGGEWTATRGDGRVGESAVRSARVGKEIETSFGRDRARGGVARGVGTRAMMRGQRGETLKEETGRRRGEASARKERN